MTALEKRLQKADRLIQKGQYERAAEILEHTLANEQIDEETCEIISAYLGNIYLALYELEKAEKNFNHAIEHNSSIAEYYYLLGITHPASLRWHEAIDVLWKALELAPEDDEYLRALGWAVFNSGDESQGRALLQEALQENLTNAVTLTDLALVYTRSTQFSEALACARRALELDPKSVLAKDVLRVIQQFKHEYDRLSLQKAPITGS